MPQNSVSRSGLDQLLVRGTLGARAHRRALSLAGLTPGRSEWRAFLQTFLLVVGTALLLAGVICFFAFNWNELGRFQKLGLVAAGVVLTFFASLALGYDRASGKMALLATSVMVGVFLAVFGQIYQTGADAWELFAGWSGLVALWVFTSRFTGHWLLFWVLTNTAIGLYLDQELGHRDLFFGVRQGDFLFIAGLNAIWLVTWEGLRMLGWRWTRPRYFPRLMAAALVLYVTVPMVAVAGGVRLPEMSEWIPVGTWLAVMGGGAAFYVLKARDIFPIAAGFASLIWVVDVPVFRSFAGGDPITFFLMGVVILLEAGGAVYCMVNLERKWKRTSGAH